MPDIVRINFDRRIVEVRSFGVVTSENIASSIAQCEKAFDEHGIDKTLVDTTEQEKMPRTLGIYRLFANFPKHLTLALLAKRNQVTEDDIIFGETVAVNRGLNMKVFYSKIEALKWLD